MTELKYMGFEELLSFLEGVTRDLTTPQSSHATKTSETGPPELSVHLAGPYGRAALERMVKWAMHVSQGTGPRTRLAGLKWAERHPEVFAQLFDPREFLYKYMRDDGLPMVLGVPRLLALLEPAERLPFIEMVFEYHFVLGNEWVRAARWAGMRTERVAQLIMEQVERANEVLADPSPIMRDARREARLALSDFVNVIGPWDQPYEKAVVPLRWTMLSAGQLSRAMLVCARRVPDRFLRSESFGLLKSLERAFGLDAAREEIGKILDTALGRVQDLARVAPELLAPEPTSNVPAVLSRAAKKAALERVDHWGTPIEAALWLALGDDELFFGLEQLGARNLPVGVVADYLTAWASCKCSEEDPKVAEMVRMHPKRVARIDAFMAQLAQENGCFVATAESGRHGDPERICVHQSAASHGVCWEQHPWALSYELRAGDVVLVNTNCPMAGSEGRVAAFMRPIRPKC